MNIVVTLDDIPEVRVESVHPIDYDRAFDLAVSAALRLNRELTRVDDNP